ncbi:putative carbamoyltransferase [Tetragenococcus halophilus subsp. halophilus]|uniref:Putative carbamoyltransferase n=1 Tax=Tetragenococcus halophilus subsp. halophilus TaxID=1513897 RepID=A0A2H6CV02_TETHA|nr:putative carbamoyltransferase [Tetragenococcus halophilus subsp. halophilus]
MANFENLLEEINGYNTTDMFGKDFMQTWHKSEDELKATLKVADALRDLRERNISTKIFDSGLGVSIFRDNSTRTRFSFASACNMLGLAVQDLDEKNHKFRMGKLSVKQQQ